jgi:hypothetical protein
MARAAATLALVLLLAGCGGSGKQAATAPPPAASTTSTTQTGAQRTSVRAYFLRDGKVAPVREEIPATQAVGAAALRALLGGPEAGFETALPRGLKLTALTIDFGVAHPIFDGDLPDSDAARAQVVYTLTQFSTVESVALPGSEEQLTRADFEQQTPRILVESPLPGDTVTSPIRVTGTSNDFEATFQLELVQGEKRLAVTHVTATSGNGTRGAFSETVAYAGSGAAKIVVFEQNAGEGPPELGRVEIPLQLR